METRKLGSLDVTIVGIGCNNFGMRIDADQTKAVVDAALDEGITLFDTADVYGGGGNSERFLAQALGSRRDEVVIATKFGMPMADVGAGASKDYVKKACEASLERLGTDRIDLYQQHAPDKDTPIDETLEALNELVDEGKVREIGHSNFNGEMIDEADAAAKGARFVSAQNHYSLLERAPEQDVIPACAKHGLGVLPYFPLASGLLTGKYTSPDDLPEGTRLALMAQAMPDRAKQVLTEENFRIVGELRAFAEQRDHTLLELAISWLANQPTTASVIAGATKPEQVKANAAGASWKLSADEGAEVAAISAR